MMYYHTLGGSTDANQLADGRLESLYFIAESGHFSVLGFA